MQQSQENRGMDDEGVGKWGKHVASNQPAKKEK